MSEIRNRGTGDILIAVFDGLKRFPEAISAVFPETIVQTCIVHLIRYSMQFASWKERKAIAAMLKPIYKADSAELAKQWLEEFDQGPWAQIPSHRAILAAQLGTSHSLLRLRPRGAQVHLHHQRHRKLRSQVRKAVRGRGHFPSDEAASKLIWLVSPNISAKMEVTTELLARRQGSARLTIPGSAYHQLVIVNLNPPARVNDVWGLDFVA